MVREGNFTVREAWLALAGFWTVGVVLLVGSLFGSVGRRHRGDRDGR